MNKLLSAGVFIVAAAAGSICFGRQTSSTKPVRLLRVTSPVDDENPGTLRWAINVRNATEDRERIELELSGSTSRLITLKAPLPPIKRPVEIEGMEWKRTGKYVVIDGSGYVPQGGPEVCPGVTAGQYGANVRTMSYPGLQLVDASDTEISGVEIRHFCIGILINRSSRVVIRDSRIVENRGGAGIMLTGDDGQGNATSTTTILNKVLRNEFIDNGDGLELTRGAAFNLVAGNLFRSTSANPEPSQGIEILLGNDNVVSSNRFEGYSDGLQINSGNRNYVVANTFLENTFGVSLSGVGNIIENNVITGNRIGIALRPADPPTIARLTRNRISGNSKPILRCEAGGTCDAAAPTGAIIFGVAGPEHQGYIGSRGGGVNRDSSTLRHICPQVGPGCDSPPNPGLIRPILTSARLTATGFTVVGTATGSKTARYVVELFGNSNATDDESQMFLADHAVYTDANSQATFTIRIDRPLISSNMKSVTATITSAEGATSPLSTPFRVTRVP